ncbi:MAG: IS1380 family transposase [Gammaproteobacteria bacterium]|nr:IS1380 family transposase [Gammaproteobacteria bacterium]
MHNRKKASTRKARQKSAKVHFQKTGKNMTSKAGLIPVIKFLDKLGFNQLFQKTVNHERKDNAFYRLEEGVFLILTGLIGGAFSISKCALLWSGCRVLQKAAGWLRIPDETTLGRLFKEVGARHISEMETLIHVLRKTVWQKALREGNSNVAALQTLWIDVDSSVKTVYGKQEGVAKGYNPHKKGAYSYHPQLAFCTHTKEILQGWLRMGSAYTSNGVVEFMKQLLAQLPASQRIIFRGDSGYFVGALLDYLDALGHGYLIKVKLKNLATLLARQQWTAIDGKPGWEQCRFWHCAKGWNASRLFVAVRQEKDREYSPQHTLLDVKSYDYFCYVTTENKTEWETHKCYGQRATSETWIEEAKSQLGLAHIKTNDFFANAVLFQSAILAYNTLRWMALTSNNAQLKKWEPESIRVYFICVAGKLLTGGNQIRIVLPEKHLHATPWDDWLQLAV